MARASLRSQISNLPNLLTMARIILIPVVLVLLGFGTPAASFIAAAFFSLASVTDFLDGYLARRNGQISVLGKFLDPLADKLIVMATLVLLTAQGRVAAWVVVVILARELAISGLRSIASSEGIVIAAGKMGKKKTAFQLVGILCLMIHYTYPLDLLFFTLRVNFHKVGYVLLLISVAYSLASAWEYFSGFYHAALKDKDGDEGGEAPTAG